MSNVFLYFKRFVIRYHGILLLFKTKWSFHLLEILTLILACAITDQDGQDTSRPPPNSSHPYGQYFKLCQGNKLRKKLPWAKSATQGLVKSETDLLSICKSRLLFFHWSILKFSLHLACPRPPKNLTQEEELIRRRPAKSFPTTNEMLNKILKSESVGNWEFSSE